MWFLVGSIIDDTGAVTTRAGAVVQAFSTSAKPCTNSYGLLVKNMAAYNSPTNTAGILVEASTTAVGTNKYGLLISDQSGATNNYAIQTGTGLVRFGDSVKIRDDSKYLYFGAGDDASITYDGTDFLFNSQVVGTGNYKFQNGNIVLTAGVDIRPTANSTTAINIAQADGTDFVTFDTTNKRVGIGITPSYLFHARLDQAAATYSYLDNENASGISGFIVKSDSGGVSFQSCGSTSGGLVPGFAGWGRFRSDSSLNGFAIITGGSKPLTFNTNDTERARFLGTGELGIGTTTPLSPVHLEFTDSATNDLYNMFRIRRVSSGTVANEFGAGILFDLEDAAGTARNATRIHTRWVDATNLYPRIGFDIRVSGSLVEQVNIQDGKVEPTTDNDIDLGNSTYQYKDGYFNGTLYTDGRILSYVVKTDTYTATTDDDVIICNKASAMDIDLPAATGSGRRFTIKNINTGTVTIDPDGAETVDGAASYAVPQWDSITVLDYASGAWVII
jgi:hypothetical protein